MKTAYRIALCTAFTIACIVLFGLFVAFPGQTLVTALIMLIFGFSYAYMQDNR